MLYVSCLEGMNEGKKTTCMLSGHPSLFVDTSEVRCQDDEHAQSASCRGGRGVYYDKYSVQVSIPVSPGQGVKIRDS